MTNSIAKGKAGERELAKKLRELGYDCRRGQQHSGSPDSPDVIGLPHIHIECKRVQKPSWSDDWLLQAKRDCGDKIPCVIHRRNNEEWKVTMSLGDWMRVFKGDI